MPSSIYDTPREKKIPPPSASFLYTNIKLYRSIIQAKKKYINPKKIIKGAITQNPITIENTIKCVAYKES